MNKIHTKLIAIILTLALSVTVMVMATYAWFVLSESPAVTGLQVAIGGGNTILVAADITKVVDGVTYHYPDSFDDTLHFNQHPSYGYLDTLAGLTPVSTADGFNWFLPAYYTTSDIEVKNGLVPNGALKDVSDFTLDYDMAHANLSATDEDAITEGSYTYLDFWVVSPSADFTLRISTGENSGGSFLVDLLQAEKTADGKYTLTEKANLGAAAARVGFLANTAQVTDDSMLYYQDYYSYKEQYTKLRGVYQDARTGSSYTETGRFTIYEPNGDHHPLDPTLAGSYVTTRPVGLVNGQIAATDISSLLTSQKTSTWQQAQDGQAPLLEQLFQTALLGNGMDTDTMTAQALTEHFYEDYLQGQISSYVDKGDFIARSADLGAFSGTIPAAQFAELDAAGATEDVYIVRLEKNIPQRIRMFIWLEGQDVDCVDEVRGASFAVNIELAGGTE